MSVVFDEPPIITSAPAARLKPEGVSISGFLIKNKIVRTEDEANVLMLGTFVVLVLVTVLMLWLGLRPSQPPEDVIIGEPVAP